MDIPNLPTAYCIKDAQVPSFSDVEAKKQTPSEKCTGYGRNAWKLSRRRYRIFSNCHLSLGTFLWLPGFLPCLAFRSWWCCCDVTRNRCVAESSFEHSASRTSAETQASSSQRQPLPQVQRELTERRMTSQATAIRTARVPNALAAVSGSSTTKITNRVVLIARAMIAGRG